MESVVAIKPDSGSIECLVVTERGSTKSRLVPKSLFLPSTLVVLMFFTSTCSGQNVSHIHEAASTELEEQPLVVHIISNIGKPGVLLFNRESTSNILLRYALNCSSSQTAYTILAKTSAQDVAKITQGHVFTISCRTNQSSSPNTDSEYGGYQTTNASHSPDTVTGEVNLTVSARVIGRSILFLLASPTGRWHQASYRNTTSDVKNSQSTGASRFEEQGPGEAIIVARAMVIVMQLPRTLDEVFRISLYVVIVLANAAMGVKVDLLIIKNVLRRPTAPIIGLVCQYLCMPLIAYLVAKTIPQDSAALSLGIFACGIAPGGGPSNIFTYLLGGDLSLSVTMTTVSNIAALGLLPLWIFTLGETFMDDTIQLHVPFEKILEALAIVILPLVLGILAKYKLPRVALMIGKVLKPVLVVVVIYTVTLGIYTNWHMFQMMKPVTFLAGCLLPYIGYLVGGLVSFLGCRSWSHIKTIAIETGVQNTTIAFLILYMSLPPPENQLATLSPAASAVMTPLPLLLAIFLYLLYNRWRNRAPQQHDQTHKTPQLEQNGTDKTPNGEEEHDGEKTEEKTLVKAILQADEEAAIVFLWQKLTGKRPATGALGQMLNKELEITSPGNDHKLDLEET